MQPVIPWYVAPIVMALVITLAYWLYRLISRAADSAELTPDLRRRVRRAVAVFLGGWLVLALVFARATPATDASGNGVVPASFPLFALLSLGFALGLLMVSPTWRKVVDAIRPEALIGTQVFRLIGFQFLLLYAIGSLPRHFALPAGWGDIAVGALAPLVALSVRSRLRGARGLALGWNLFGFLDLVAAVGLGTGYLLALLPGQPAAPVAAAAMTFFPLVLIPTFAVPIAFILHIYSIRQTLRSGAAWRRGSGTLRAHTGGIGSVSRVG